MRKRKFTESDEKEKVHRKQVGRVLRGNKREHHRAKEQCMRDQMKLR
jgi:hypothetical protein